MITYSGPEAAVFEALNTLFLVKRDTTYLQGWDLVQLVERGPLEIQSTVVGITDEQAQNRVMCTDNPTARLANRIHDFCSPYVVQLRQDLMRGRL